MPSTTPKQKEYRKSLKDRGYKRLDIQISPELFKKLKPHFRHYDGQAGHALVEFLERLMKSGTLDMTKKT